MDTLDNINQFDEKSVSVWNPALRMGALASLGLIALSLFFRLIGLDPPSSLTSMILYPVIWIAVFIGLGWWFISKHRNEDLDGYISFKRAFLVSFVAMLVASALNTIFMQLYTSFLDTGYYDKAVEGMIDFYTKIGIDRDQIEEQGLIEQLEAQYTTQRLILSAVLGPLIGSAFWSLIAAAIFKRNRPEATLS